MLQHGGWGTPLELYRLLGTALMTAGRYEEAAEAFAKALEEARMAPDGVEADVYHSLSEAMVKVAESDLAARPEAVRTALEVTLLSEEAARIVPGAVVRLVDRNVLEQNARWIAHVWLPGLHEVESRHADTPACALLAGRAHLYEGDHEIAFDLFRRVAASAWLHAELHAADRLTIDALPLPFVAAEPGMAYFVLGQAAEALGRIDTAVEHLLTSLESVPPPPDELAVRNRLVRLLKLIGGREPDAARELLSVASIAATDGQWRDAIAAASEASTLDPSSAPARWHCADYRRLAADRDEYPWVDLDMLREAERDFEAGLRLSTPDSANDATVYLVLALIEDRLSDHDVSPADRSWRAILAAEQALALDPRSADAWAVAARCQRTLRLYAASRYALAQAKELDPHNLVVAEEEVAWHLETMTEEVFDVIERSRARRPEFESAFAAASGFARLLKGEVGAALEILDGVVEAASARAAFAFRLFRAHARSLEGRAADAERDYEYILRLSDQVDGSSNSPVLSERAWSLCMLGRAEDAAPLFATLEGGLGRDPVDPQLGLACCAVARGDLSEAARRLDGARKSIVHRGDALTIGLALDTLRARGLAADPQAEELLAQAAAEAREVAEATEAMQAAEAFARADLDIAVRQTTEGSIAWTAGNAGLARLSRARGDPALANSLYGSIAERAPRLFPQARALGLECLRAQSDMARKAGEVDTTREFEQQLQSAGVKAGWEAELAVAEARVNAGDTAAAEAHLSRLLNDQIVRAPEQGEPLLRIGDALLAVHAMDAAERAYEAAARAARVTDDLELLARRSARLAFVAALRGDIASAHSHCRRAVQAVTVSASDPAAGQVVIECEQLASTAGVRGALSPVLRSLCEDPELDPWQRRAVSGARFTKLREHSTARLEPALPIVAAVDPRWLPEGPESPLAVRLLRGLFPEVRARLATRAGVMMPGVKLSGQPRMGDDPADYAILVREVRYASGTLPPDHRLCPNVPTLRKLGIDGLPVFSPDGEPMALWLDRAASQAAAVEALELLDEAEALAWHLESVVRAELVRFVGVSEIESALKRWTLSAGDDARRAILERARADKSVETGLLRVIRRLVKEQVPVDQIGAVLTAQAESLEQNLDTIRTVERARELLSQTLPPDRLRRDVVRVDPDLEQEVSEHVYDADRTRVLALPPESLERLFGQLQLSFSGRPSDEVALVVSNPDLRPFIQRLSESRWPRAVVITEREAAALGRATFLTAPKDPA
jgi:tetratricopeptide (TPR) repeat protein